MQKVDFAYQEVKTTGGFMLKSGFTRVVGKDADYPKIKYVVGQTNDGMYIQGSVKDGDEYDLFQSSEYAVKSILDGKTPVTMINMLTIPTDVLSPITI